MTLDISSFQRIKVLVIGDLMIDEYLWGEVDRISPEAPVPIVTVKKESNTMGGAGNVINNLVAMGARVSVIGTAGTGTAGKTLLEQFQKLGVETRGIVVEKDRPTTKKTRIIASNQQVLRIDRETKKEISQKTFNRLAAYMDKAVPEMDLVIISDYDKGLVTREVIRHLTAITAVHNILTLADPKGLDYSKYKNVSLLTPNQKEAGQAAGMTVETEEDLIRAGRCIMKKVGLERLIITCGKDGMLLFDNALPHHRIKSEAQQVFDVSGAGDTVIATLGLALASRATFVESAMAANAAAGIVVAKVGTATATRKELRCAIKAMDMT